ncbi:hypothetical protein NN561_013517 [Cricetulus griseus]
MRTIFSRHLEAYREVISLGRLLLRRNNGLYGEKLLGSYGQQRGQPQSCHWDRHVTPNMASPKVPFRKGRSRTVRAETRMKAVTADGSVTVYHGGERDGTAEFSGAEE